MLPALLLGLSLLLPAQDPAGEREPAQEGAPLANALHRPLVGLRAGHPRLLLTEERLAELRALPAADPLFARALGQVLDRADGFLGAPPLERVLKGPRLLSVSRACVDRVQHLGFAWRWTGEQKYARAVEENLLAVAAFSDWNPSHFLDVAEMTHAVGIGYDWCYEALSEQTRATVRAALVAKGLDPGLRGYEAERPAWWVRSEFNWNQVCNGGLLVGALALADEEPDRAARVVRHAVESLPTALATYEPDGAWGEGPGYWSYATHYTAYGLSALETALGHTFRVSDRPGLAESGWFPLLGTGPTGMYAAIADVGERARRGALPPLFWLAQRYQKPYYSLAERTWLAENRATPMHLVWWQSEPTGFHEGPPLCKLFRGPVEVAFLRSGWDENDFYVAFKAGYNQVNHGHLDLGSFELEFDGVRWARDLGKDDYNLPGYWDKKEGGRRWSYYRLGSFSHNLLLPAGIQQHANATARFTDWVGLPGNGKQPWQQIATVDTAGLFPGVAHAARRTITLHADRALVVDDTIGLMVERGLVWGMSTDAEIELQGDRAWLRQDGRRLGVRVLLPEGAAFSTAIATQAPPQKKNKGVQRLELRLPPQSGEVRVVVAFDPVRSVYPPLSRAYLLGESPALYD